MLGIRKPLARKPGVVRRPSRTGEGAFVGDQRNSPGKLERGQIIDVFPDTMTALVSCRQGLVPATLPREGSLSGDSPTGGVTLPFRGAEVIVSTVNGQCHVLAYTAPKDRMVLDTESDARRFELVYDAAGGEKGHYKNKGYTRRSGMNHTGLLPGDSVKIGRLGNIMGILDGGINIFRAHDAAQILAFAREQMVKIVASQYKLFTDFGKVEHITDERGATLSVRGAGGAASEASKEAWTIRGDLGARGDLVNLRVTTDTGFDLARVWVGRLGNVYTKTKDHVSDVLGNAKTNFRGTLTATVDKVTTLTYKDYVVTTAEKLFEEKLDSFKRTVTNTSFTSVMDDDTHITGGLKTAIAVDGYDLDVTSGPVQINVGKDATEQKDVDWSLRQGNFSVKTDVGGNLVFTTPQGDVKLTTSLGSAKINTNSGADSVVLGGDIGVAHVVRYEELKAALDAIALALDSHTHTLINPATPGVSHPPLATGAIAASVNTLVPQAKSTVVTVSG